MFDAWAAVTAPWLHVCGQVAQNRHCLCLHGNILTVDLILTKTYFDYLLVECPIQISVYMSLSRSQIMTHAKITFATSYVRC